MYPGKLYYARSCLHSNEIQAHLKFKWLHDGWKVLHESNFHTTNIIVVLVMQSNTPFIAHPFGDMSD